MHRCPVDKSALRLKSIGDGREAYRCTECGGVWLPGATVRDAIGEVPGSALKPLRVNAHLPCPLDGGPLRVLVHRKIEIDVCGRCSGVWLDAGELQSLQEGDRRHSVVEYAKEAVIAAPEIAPLFAGKAARGLDEVIDFVGDALAAIF